MASLRSILYGVARFMGDVRAVRRGPAAIVKRVERKAAWRLFASFMSRVIR